MKARPGWLVGGAVVLAVLLQMMIILGSGPQEGVVTRMATDRGRYLLTVRPEQGPEITFRVPRETFTVCKRVKSPRYWHKAQGWPVDNGRGSCWTPR